MTRKRRALCTLFTILGIAYAANRASAMVPAILTLTRSGDTLMTSDTSAKGLPGDSLMIVLNADHGAVLLTLEDGNAPVTIPGGTLTIGQSITLSSPSDQTMLGFPTAGGYAFSAASMEGTTNPVSFSVQVSTATQTSITSVTPEPSDLYGAVDVVYLVTGVTVQPSGRVRVTASDGSFCQGAIASDGPSHCSLSFGSAGTVMLTATYLGDGTLDPSSDMTSHTVSPAPIVLSGLDLGTVGASYQLDMQGLTPNGSASVDFGAGAMIVPVASDGTASAAHLFAQEGGFVITVTDVSGPDGGVAPSASKIVSIFAGPTLPATLQAGQGTSLVAAGSTLGSSHISAVVTQTTSTLSTLLVGIYDRNPVPAAPSGSGPGAFYDIRALQLALNATVSAIFSVPDGLSGSPATLEYFDSASQQYQPVVSNSPPAIEPWTHTITFSLDSSSRPTPAELSGTVFAVGGRVDAGVPDAAVAMPDGAPADANATAADAGSPATGSSGCGCRVAAGPGTAEAPTIAAWLLSMGLLIALFGRSVRKGSSRR